MKRRAKDLRRRAKTVFNDSLGRVGIEGTGFKAGHPIATLFFLLASTTCLICFGVLIVLCLAISPAMISSALLTVFEIFVASFVLSLLTYSVAAAPSNPELEIQIVDRILRDREIRRLAYLRGETV